MRQIFFLLCLGLLAACGAAPAAPTASPPAAPALLSLSEIDEQPQDGPVELAGFVVYADGGARLVERLDIEGERLAPAGDQLWLGAVEPPAGGATDERGGLRYGLARVLGVVQGPGAFGPDGAARFQIVEPRLSALSVRELSIPLLLGNPALYDGEAVQISGQLLASPSSTLLVEQLGPGGVPSAESLQVKVSPLDTAPLGPGFAGEQGSAVRFGPAELVGLWRGGQLLPLAITPSP